MKVNTRETEVTVELVLMSKNYICAVHDYEEVQRAHSVQIEVADTACIFCS
jgi:hypothetical protein